MLEIIHGNCLDVMRLLPAGCIDAVVCDPPYELGFMGKSWDSTGVAFDPATWREVLRVLKPGGHMLAFGGSRTYHRIACAIEDAGFEIRDTLQWLYGTGFPKSRAIDKDIDRSLGAERPKTKVVGTAKLSDWLVREGGQKTHAHHDLCAAGIKTALVANDDPITPEAAQWSGWGTALKPAYEPIILARKPLAKKHTVATNVLAYGTGGINVDGCRVGDEPISQHGRSGSDNVAMSGRNYAEPAGRSWVGRWPANVILDEAAAALLDAQSGISKDGVAVKRNTAVGKLSDCTSFNLPNTGKDQGYGGSGGASRFFYVAKASKSEREAGLDHLPLKSAGELTDRQDDSAGLESPRAGAGRGGERRNGHPTVKPISLMRWLCRLVTPPGGIVLDPFAGSGTTGCAAALEGLRFVGIEMTDEYVELARARLAHWSAL